MNDSMLPPSRGSLVPTSATWARAVSAWADAGLGEAPPEWLVEYPEEAMRIAHEARAAWKLTG